jgi:hypothetical protein
MRLRDDRGTQLIIALTVLFVLWAVVGYHQGWIGPTDSTSPASVPVTVPRTAR